MTHCKNCQQPLATEDNFCRECGAAVIQHRLTLKYLFQEFYNSFFSIDSSKPVLTFIDLFKKPEVVIGGYINGLRKRYIHAFGYFTIAITLSSFFFFIFLKFFPDLLENAFSYQNEMNAAQKKMNQEIMQKTFEYQSLIFFASIPLLSLMAWIVFFNKRKYNYAENLIIVLYGYSQASIVSVIFYFLTVWNSTLFGYATLSVLIVQIGYFAYIFKRLYKLSIGQLIIKTLFFLAILITIYIVLVITVIIFMAATGNLQQFAQ
ncbi:DUF3667 domain-containing protein [Aequorivita echinoideorum]|uniref:DUF3667 domain-containing protein n=1 Tax=Aequorivita echinoideorum TaxID=1549647 RepID=A0ABS5S767_9FLAO|nr:DUF3667 domain-containing protein [Aequorivita echinoideorum]MBT0609062.1 DUF3667 domain-containing protein [Aequorivita echinoideorum]